RLPSTLKFLRSSARAGREMEYTSASAKLRLASFFTDIEFPLYIVFDELPRRYHSDGGIIDNFYRGVKPMSSDFHLFFTPISSIGSAIGSGPGWPRGFAERGGQNDHK